MVGQRISDAIEQDHQEIMACYGRIVNSSVRDEQIRFQNLFTWDLARLLVGEEIVVYPALEKHLSDGVSLAEKDRKVHQTVSIWRLSPIFPPQANRQSRSKKS